MPNHERIQALEETVDQLKIEIVVLKEILGQQIVLNNLNYQGKFDDVLAALANEYAGREGVDNQRIHNLIHEYIKYQPPSAE